MKIDFVKTLEASSPYTPGRIYFEESTSLIKVATASNQYRVFGGVRSADYDSSTDILTILNGNGDEVYIDFSQYVNQDEYEDDQYVISVALTELNNNISSISDEIDYLNSQVSDMGYSMQELQNSIENFYFVEGTSSQAGNGTSGSYLSTKWEGTIQGGAITTPYNGLKVAYRIKTNAGVATAGAVLSIDGGTNYYPVVYNVNSAIGTRYSPDSTILMTFNSTQTAIAYLTSNTKTTITGCWQIMDYDANSYAYIREYQHGDNAAGTAPEYPLLARFNVTNKNGTYDTAYSRYHTGATLNTTTGALTATAFIKSGGTASQFLKADGTVDSNSYITSSDIPAMTTDASVAAWGYLKANDVSTKVDKADAVKSLSLEMNSSTYTITLSGTMADGSTFTVGNPVDLPLETVVVDGSYNSVTKKVVLGLKNGSSVEFSVADLVAGLQSEITSSNKLSADLIQDGTTNKVVTATDKTNWNSLVSNVQSDWNATTGLAAILNKPDLSLYMTIEDYEEDEEVVAASLNDLNDRILELTSQIPTDASVSDWGYIKNALTGINFNGVDASVTNGVASITADIIWSSGTGTKSAKLSSNSVVSGNYSAATGIYNQILSNYSFVNGAYSKANGQSSFASGIFVSAANGYGGGAAFGGNYASGISLTGEANATTYTGTISDSQLKFLLDNYNSTNVTTAFINGAFIYDANLYLAKVTGFSYSSGTLTITFDKTLSSTAISNKSYNLIVCISGGECSTTFTGFTSNNARWALAGGRWSAALAETAFSWGNMSVAAGTSSFALGHYAQTKNTAEVGIGKFNKSTSSKTAFSVGIGTSHSARKNAFEIMNDGSIYVIGIGSYDGTNYSSASTLQSVLSNVPAAITESTIEGWGFTKNAAPGTLKTNNTTAQTASASESLSGTINLHKVAKTGTYSDLIDIPLSISSTDIGQTWFPSYNEGLGANGSFGGITISTYGIRKDSFSDWSWIQYSYSSSTGTVTNNLQDYLDVRCLPTPTTWGQIAESYFNTTNGNYEWKISGFQFISPYLLSGPVNIGGFVTSNSGGGNYGLDSYGLWGNVSNWSWIKIVYSSNGTTVTETLEKRLLPVPTVRGQFLGSYLNSSTGKYEWKATDTLVSTSNDWSWLVCNPATAWTLQDTLNGKQNTLVGSGTGQNIKTVNNNSLVGSGNVSVGTLTGVKFNNVSATINGTVAEITATIPSEVTESTVSGWGFTKNTGTLTAHATHKLTATNNNATSTSGTITFVESLTGTNTATSGDLTITATRKSVTIPAAANNATITIQKGGTNVDSFTVDASSNKTINIPNELPAVTASDNGKILRVVNGAWAADTVVTVYSGSNEPTSSQGINGDIYIQS